MENFVKHIEEHPLATGLIVLVVGGVFLYMIGIGGSNPSSATTADPSLVAAATDAQHQQYQAWQSSLAAATGLQQQQEADATQLALANIGVTVANNNLQVQQAGIAADQNVKLAAINAGDHASTLNAQVQTAGLTAEIQNAQIQATQQARAQDYNYMLQNELIGGLLSQTQRAQSDGYFLDPSGAYVRR